jgi:hypothetical protein
MSLPAAGRAGGSAAILAGNPRCRRASTGLPQLPLLAFRALMSSSTIFEVVSGSTDS